MDINSTDFLKTFDIKNGTVGLVGHGYVGKAVENFFKKATKVVVYDKVKEMDTLEDVVSQAQIIFVCVPTPMRKDGSCHTGIVESVIEDIKTTANTIGRDLSSFVLVVKSTVYPGFTEDMQEKHFDMRITFSPEFLTEKNSLNDFENQNRVIIGGDEQDSLVVFKFFQGVMPQKVDEDRVLLVQCNPTTAEMTKLYTNGILMTKILFSNEIYLMCQKLGVEYEEVRVLACLDRRIGSSHTTVPGHDGNLGAGGHCFPKDLNNLRCVAKELGVEEKIFTAVLYRNAEVRDDKDWEKMEGRAVISE